jgi:hypothetical protein
MPAQLTTIFLNSPSCPPTPPLTLWGVDLPASVSILRCDAHGVRSKIRTVHAPLARATVSIGRISSAIGRDVLLPPTRRRLHICQRHAFLHTAGNFNVDAAQSVAILLVGFVESIHVTGQSDKANVHKALSNPSLAGNISL